MESNDTANGLTQEVVKDTLIMLQKYANGTNDVNKKLWARATIASLCTLAEIERHLSTLEQGREAA